MARRTALSLRARLTLLVAVVVAVVIGIESYLEIRVFQSRVQNDILEAAGSTAQAITDDLEARGGPARVSSPQLHALLQDFRGARPAIRDIAVVMLQPDGPSLAARTSASPVDDLLPVVRQTVELGTETWSGEGRERTLAAPLVQQGRVVGAVTVTVSLASIEQLRSRGREVTIWFAVPAIVVLTLLVDLLSRRFVHAPLAGIRQAMHRAGAGELGVRVDVGRNDEMGTVARGLNEMLARVERFQTDLQARVDDATRELRQTNTELVESYHRVLTLREALARAEQLAALGQMAANVAHQIGTPLNLISGYVQLMIEEAGVRPGSDRGQTGVRPGSEQGQTSLHRLQTVDAQIRRVTDIVRSMLDYARRPGLQRESVNVAALVDQVCEISRPALRAANVEVLVEASGSLPSISADPTQLELALLNLVSNSLDAMPSGGRLDISLSERAGGVRLVIADSGTGIPATVLTRVFEPWVTTKAPGRGTGLGLSITRDVIESHGGFIGVRSEPGHGTVFTIDLPAASASAAVSA
jgi:two-component system, NtrC family, sensor kinase